MANVFPGSYSSVSYTASQISGLTASSHTGRVYYVSDLGTTVYSDGTNWIYSKPVNSLSTGGTTSPLSAEQGKALATRVTALESTSEGIAAIHVFQSVNDGVTDETAALQAAVTAYRHVFIPANTTVCVSKQVVQPVNSILSGAGRSSVIKALGNITLRQDNNQGLGDAGGFAGQAQCMIRASHRSQIKNIFFEGNNFKSGGVQVWHVNDVLIEDVWVVNAVNFSLGGSDENISTSAVNCFNADRVTVNRLWVSRALYGVQLWRCDDALISDCYHDVGRGGFWTTNCNRNIFRNLWVSNMNDVGLDAEGGTDTYFIDCHAEACKNGELALFNGNEDGGADESGADIRLQFIGCTARRTPTYIYLDGTAQNISNYITNGCGALFVASISNGSRECGFYNCKITIEADTGFFMATQGTRTDAEDWEIEIEGCTFVHKSPAALFRVTDACRGMKVRGNKWTVDAAVTSSAVWKNPDRSIFEDNHFIFNVAPTATDYVILVYQDVAPLVPARPGIMARCWFGGPEANFRMVKQQANHASGGLGTFIYQENSFSQKPVLHGGLFLDNLGAARPIFRRQKLSFLATKPTGAAAETFNVTDTTLFSSHFGGANQDYMPFGTGIIHVREFDTTTGVASTTNQNSYPFAMTQGGGIRLMADYAPAPNGGPAPGGVVKVGEITLSAATATTDISVPFVQSDCIVLLTPKTATAATAVLTAPGVYQSGITVDGTTPTNSKVTLTHSATLGAGVTFNYEIKRVGTPGFGAGSGISRSAALYCRDQGIGGNWFSQYINFTKSGTAPGLMFQMEVEFNSPPRSTLNGATVEFM